MAVYEGRPLVMEMEREEDQANGCGCGCGYGCFRIFPLKWWWQQQQGHDEEGKHLLEQKGIRGGEETWVMEKMRKMKEVSEVVAGPKWKTFLRKIISGYGKKKNNRFQYDEHSYALNFNSGGAQSEDEGYLPPSFSSRFSAPLPPVRQNQTSS